MERYKKTAQSSNSFSEKATIINPIHPLHGQSLTVHTFRRLGTLLSVIFEHPSGGLISVPVSETSLEAPPPLLQIEGVTPRFDPKKLLQLTILVSTLGSTGGTSIEDEAVIKLKIDAKTADHIQHQDLGDRRKTREIDQSNSPVSRKNPRPKDVTKAKKGEN